MANYKLTLKNQNTFCLIYLTIFLILVGVLNYFTWTEGPVRELNLLYLVIWFFLYTPAIILHNYGDWQITEFGFTFNSKILFLTVLSFAYFLFTFNLKIFYSWQASLIEALARTGEELFFRGFLYTYLIKAFRKKDKPYIWAIIISSICFALIHTQVFLPNYNTSMLDIFILSLLLTIFRRYFNSILPGIIIHVLIKSNFLGLIFSVVIYYIFVLFDKNFKVSKQHGSEE